MRKTSVEQALVNVRAWHSPPPGTGSQADCYIALADEVDVLRAKVTYLEKWQYWARPAVEHWQAYDPEPEE